uniref:putative WEB family protein At1g65010, chloroplastic n=1 Tax=Monopterus albus TaxID=43700 RepID=UPI0009B464E8|nr:putative WEB family protein At1g65010, chloroplastic [Monopterus albus]
MKAQSALPADAHSSGKNEKPPAVENKEQSVVTPKPVSIIAEEEPQQAADKKSSTGSEVNLDQPKQALLQTPETDLHLLLAMKDDQISDLINQKALWEQEKSFLLNWVNTEVHKYMEANSCLQANLSHVQKMLENERNHWYKEKSYLMEYIVAMRQGTNLKEEESTNNLNLHVENQGSEDLHLQDKSAEFVSDREQTVIQEPSCLTAPSEEASGHGAQEPQPANPWKNNFQGVPDLKSCLQLNNTDFPELQRGPVKRQEQGKNQQTRSQKKTFRQRGVFGLFATPAQQSAVTLKPLPTIAEEEPQQAADKKSSTASEVNLDQPKKTLLPIPGTGLHLLVCTKDGETDELVKERAGLLTKLEELKDQLKIQKSKDLSHRSQCKEAISNLKVDLIQAKTDLENQRIRWEEEKSRLLTEHTEAASKLKATLIEDLEKNLENERRQWEEERSRLLIEHADTSISLRGTLIQVKNDLANERSKWENEKSHLLAQHIKAASSLKATLTQELENKRCQWDNEKCHLLI